MEKLSGFVRGEGVSRCRMSLICALLHVWYLDVCPYLLSSKKETRVDALCSSREWSSHCFSKISVRVPTRVSEAESNSIPLLTSSRFIHHTSSRPTLCAERQKRHQEK